MNNPFVLGVIPPGAPFCDRSRELKELTSYAKNKANVVLYSPRRYGKTSLIKRVQSMLADKGFIAIYIDLIGVTSIDEVAHRTVKSIYTVTQHNESLFKKTIRILKTFRPVLKPTESGDAFSLTVEAVTGKLSGIDLLDATMENLGEFIHKTRKRIHIVFDEFQEITELNSQQIEGVLRSHIQGHGVSYFFVGSRRRLLLDMFSQRNRPFFQSSIIYELDRLPHGDLVNFIMDCFQDGGKHCLGEVAEEISKKVLQHPYYAQKLSFYEFEMTAKTAKIEDVTKAYERVFEEERFFFEATLQGITLKQISLLKAIANDPFLPIFSTEFLSKYRLAQGMIQKALRKLAKLDLIEKNEKNSWQIVDPVFEDWLRRM
jgi:AAA+ ATPase superfamily predicted ATPase